MSYTKDLEEYADAELIAELNRREQLRNTGKCPYCRRDAQDEPCLQAEQHERARKIAELRQLKRSTNQG